MHDVRELRPGGFRVAGSQLPRVEKMASFFELLMTTSSQTANNHLERLRALWSALAEGLLLVVAVFFAYQPAWHAASSGTTMFT